VEIAQARRRFGYRRIHDMLREHFPGVNHKRVYRLYSEANLAVRRAQEGQAACGERMPLQWPKRSMKSGAWTSSATAWPTAGASSS
jgi:hypothetical protein